MEWIRHTSWDGRMECVMALYHTSFPINERIIRPRWRMSGFTA